MSVDLDRVPTSELFVDERGAGLRVAWDDSRGLVVVSMWRDGRCIGTHPLGGVDVGRLASVLNVAVVEGLRSSLRA